MRFFKALIILFCSFCIVLAGAGVITSIGYSWLEQWGEKSFFTATPVEVSLEPGMPLSALSEELFEKGIVSSKDIFKWWVKYCNDYSSFQAGNYRFEDSLSPTKIAAMMKNGDVHVPVLFELAIPEGFTVKQIAARAENLGICSEQELLQNAFSPKFTEQFDIPVASLEGYLFPATYALTEQLTAQELLQKMVNTFFSRLPDDYKQNLAQKGLSLHQGVIFASLIERETQLDSERDMVSEVIWNRLNKKIALGIDASIIYGIKDYDGNIRRRHLDDKSNIYNTRLHRGLPPGPIASPGTASLEAVLKPTSHGFYYYVVDADNLVQHRFSRTLKEHNSNVAAYLRAIKARKK